MANTLYFGMLSGQVSVSNNMAFAGPLKAVLREVTSSLENYCGGATEVINLCLGQNPAPQHCYFCLLALQQCGKLRAGNSVGLR